VGGNRCWSASLRCHTFHYDQANGTRTLSDQAWGRASGGADQRLRYGSLRHSPRSSVRPRATNRKTPVIIPTSSAIVIISSAPRPNLIQSALYFCGGCVSYFTFASHSTHASRTVNGRSFNGTINGNQWRCKRSQRNVVPSVVPPIALLMCNPINSLVLRI